MTLAAFLLIAAGAAAGIYALYQVIDRIPDEFDVHP